MRTQTVERHLEEAYQHIKPYLKDQEDLRKMCARCGDWCGEQHDYEHCRHEPCFEFYLGYFYMVWCDSFGG